ncbi:unknown protein [Waddlia chondrophila 2032/99]|uniref:Uncharacterized protein n=1 Tax=Waddlia chondrophila 2032/99 TaxID=765953 RepID=F8LES9_9BACT|nr:unknown protein [Waddlia chondrophila 2032/99]
MQIFFFLRDFFRPLLFEALQEASGKEKPKRREKSQI